MEHLHHFGLAKDPFCNEPLLDLFLETQQHRDALRRLERGVRQQRGLCVLGGEVGAGKTMILRRLLESLEEEVFEATMMVVLTGSADAVWILTRFARQLGIEDLPAEREAIVARIYEQLAIIREDGRHAVLIIDDAQALADGSTLAEVAGLLKLEYEDRRLLTLVLAGAPQFEEALAADPVLSARVEVRVRVAPLTPEAGNGYVTHRIRSAGGAVAILEERAMSSIHRLGGGLPGRMNLLADNALFEAFLCDRPQVTEADVERAHRDLTANAPAPAPPPAAAAPAAAPPAREPAPLLGDDDFGQSEHDLEGLDSELEAVLSGSPGPSLRRPGPDRAMAEATQVHLRPAKDSDDEVEDLLVELLDD